MKAELQKSRQVLTMSTVMALSDLTARQIRYYEEQGLVIPARSAGGHRLYSLDDIEKLLEVKSYLEEGDTIAEIHQIFKKLSLQEKKKMTPEKVRRALEDQIKHESPFFRPGSGSSTFG